MNRDDDDWDDEDCYPLKNDGKHGLSFLERDDDEEYDPRDDM